MKIINVRTDRISIIYEAIDEMAKAMYDVLINHKIKDKMIEKGIEEQRCLEGESGKRDTGKFIQLN
ncbi:MAG: hypothetical protein K8R25_07045 [Methanosarcinales archaeon]|nr:hypothetical protein [Methanosarcinales archaeon]